MARLWALWNPGHLLAQLFLPGDGGVGQRGNGAISLLSFPTHMWVQELGHLTSPQEEPGMMLEAKESDQRDTPVSPQFRVALRGLHRPACGLSGRD